MMNSNSNSLLYQQPDETGAIGAIHHVTGVVLSTIGFQPFISGSGSSSKHMVTAMCPAVVGKSTLGKKSYTKILHLEQDIYMVKR